MSTNFVQIVEDYKNGRSTVQIAKDRNFSRQYIHQILLNNNVQCRKVHNIYKCDFSKFEKIDTKEKAYWLGFLAADGNLHKGKIRIHLHKKDKEHLEKFRSFLMSNHPIYPTNKKKNYNQNGITICSKKMCNDLENLGIVEKKSLILDFPNKVPNNLISHFIRGYFDGDGYFGFHFRKDKYLAGSVSITSTLSFCSRLSDILKDNLDINTYIRKRHKNRATTTRMMDFGGNKQVLRFLDWIYKDANVFLDRKYDRYVKFSHIYIDGRKNGQ